MSYDFCDEYSESSRSRLMLKAILLTDEQIEKYGEYMTDIEDLQYRGMYNEGTVTLSLTDAALSSDAAALKDTAADSFNVDNNGFSAIVTRDKKSLVFFSVPFDKGWTATVNGKVVEVEKVNAGFMAVAVDEGVSEIRFNYRNTGLALGTAVTLGAVAIFIIYMLASLIYIKNHPTDTEYPEGNNLLDAWHADDIAESVLDVTDDEIPIKSILDRLDDEPITQNNELVGGFKIDENIFNEENDNET
ncbi:MAG: YfhO family protein [Clostridia bacterium]|nr:YfhO family protein [Clostridia bacterium]